MRRPIVWLRRYTDPGTVVGEGAGLTCPSCPSAGIEIARRLYLNDLGKPSRNEKRGERSGTDRRGSRSGNGACEKRA